MLLYILLCHKIKKYIVIFVINFIRVQDDENKLNSIVDPNDTPSINLSEVNIEEQKGGENVQVINTARGFVLCQGITCACLIPFFGWAIWIIAQAQ